MLRWLTSLAWSRALGRSGPAVTTLSIQGLRFTLDWAAAEHVSVREILDRGEYWTTPEFRPAAGQLVVDVGANAGVFATVAGTWIGPTGRLVAIEPNPAVIERLRRNLRQNGLEPRAEVIAVGLSDEAGPARLLVGANTTIGSVAGIDDGADQGVDIELRTLDGVAAERGLTRIDLLKVDVEGLEIPVLDGARGMLKRCNRLVLEVSQAHDLPGVTERCREAGFDSIVARPAGADSGATIVFASRAAALPDSAPA
jgi:FkbM family methyltransferase